METLFTGQYHIKLSECDSVNTYAIEMLKSGNLPDGTLISAKNQTKGRGQTGNLWYSESGKNITCSLIYQTSFLSAENIFLLSMTISLAVHDLLTETLGSKHDIKIKWPNDILVDDKKICGILIENLFRGGSITSVIGIGLNVNQTQFDFVDQRAVSIKNLKFIDLDVEFLTEKLCKKIEIWYLKLKGLKFNSIRHEYLNRLYLYKTRHRFSIVDGSLLEGEICDVGLDGQILIRAKNNSFRKFRFKELIF